MSRKVYSYMRFSTSEQSKGHSLQRQTDYATQYAQDHNLNLDQSLTMRDEGLSAFHQKHISKGALGAFYRAIEDGIVEPGSVLIVENLDRLSRANPRNALPHFLNIINAGITVVIAKDGKSYSQESIDQNPYQLFESLIDMVRANKESEHKSERVKASIVAQINQWIEHGHGKIVRNGRDPYWVQPKEDKTGFDLIEERAAIVREIIALSKKGWGVYKMQEYLQSRYTPFNGERWYTSYLSNILRNRALIGERSFSVNNEKYIIKNYYPPLLSDDDFLILQNEIKNRASTKSQQRLPGIITGANFSFCGHCGSSLNTQNHKQNSCKGRDQQVTDGLRRIRCSSKRSGRECFIQNSDSVSVSAVPVERALMEYCSDRMELSSILNNDTDKSLGIKAEIAELEQQVSQAEIVISNGTQQITSLLMQGSDASPISDVVRLHQRKLDDLKSQVNKLQDELRVQKRNTPSDIIEQWDRAVDDVYHMNEEVRLQVRQIAKKTFKRIDLYLHSFNKSDTGKLLGLPIDDQSIVMLLTFINDKTRLLVIDRKTGDWVTHRDFEISEASVLSGLADDPEHLHSPAP